MIKPHKNIGPDYLHRWHLIPRNRFFNIYLHHVLKSDEARALHDHPWWSVSFLLKGKLGEQYRCGTCGDVTLERVTKQFRPVFRRPQFAHRLLLISDSAWTLFITGRWRRSWGFYCHNRWVDHKTYKSLGGCKGVQDMWRRSDGRA